MAKMLTRKNHSGGQCPCSMGKMFGGGGPLRRNGQAGGVRKTQSKTQSQTHRKSKGTRRR